MSEIILNLPYGEGRLTKGLDLAGHENITARWERVKGDCRVKVSIEMPPRQTDMPREIWEELMPLISGFVASISYASIVKADDIADADFRELPGLLQGSD